MSFATVDELQARMGEPFADEAKTQIGQLLDDATAVIRAEIGQHVAPKHTATFTDWPDAEGMIYLPQTPVRSVDAVEIDGAPVAFAWRDNYLRVNARGKVAVTFTYGFETVPSELSHWACVLAAGALKNLELGVGLTPGGLSSVAIDDFRAAWADGGDKAGMTLPAHVAHRLREAYGGGTSVVTLR